MSRRARHHGTPAEPPPRSIALAAWLERHWCWVLAALVLLYAAFAALAFDPKPFVGGDNAVYAALARSLAGGRGLAELWTPQARPHTQYPFGFPLLLSPIALLGLGYPWFKLVPLLCGGAAVLLFPALLKGRAPLAIALPALLLALNPVLIDYSHWVLSELPFMACTLLALLLLQRWERGGGAGWFAAAVAAAVFANYIRSAGIALFAGIFIYLLVKRRFRWALMFLAACIALTLPWALRNSHYGTSGGYLDQLLMKDPYQPGLGRMTGGEMLARLWQNLGLYGAHIVPRLLFPALDGWGLGGADWLFAVLVSLPALAGLVLRLARSPQALDWYAACYLGMALLWPAAWTDVRFILPLLPFLLLYLLSAYGAALTRLAPRGRAGLLVPLALLLAAATVAPSAAGWGDTQYMQSSYRNGDPLAGYDPAWRSFFEAARWVGQHTPPQAVVVSRKPPLFFLESERKSFCYPFTADADSVRAAVLRADYVMVEPVFGGT
ncbi:MAG TPA: hypothetical protein VMF29_06470, partial [Candidatus Edwardsbacteria bacterium]|nr:hypothetical protein [Candidatus Edwardsbacteria bacterium]